MPVSNSTDRFNGVLASLAIKVRCVVGVEENVSLTDISNPYSGVTVADGDRVLLLAQTNPIENGIWTANEVGIWTRTADWDGRRDVIFGTVIYAGQEFGADKVWQVQTAGDIIPGTTAVSLVLILDPNSVQSNPIVLAELADSDPDIPGFGQYWVNNNGFNPAEAYFTNENGDDQSLSRELWWNALLKVEAVALGAEVTGSVYLLTGGSVFMDEKANALVDATDSGQFWVRDDAPNVPMFTDDDGGDQLIDPSLSEVNVQNGNYTLILSDKGKTIHKVTSTSSITATIPSNASVPYKIGTLLAFQNTGTEDWDIAIDTDTLIDTVGTTGTQILMENEIAIVQKMTATIWRYAATPAPTGVEINDLTAAVTWADVPIANIPTGTTGSTVALGDHAAFGHLPDGLTTYSALRWDDAMQVWESTSLLLQFDDSIASRLVIETNQSVLALDSGSQVRVEAANFYGQYVDNNNFLRMTESGSDKVIDTGINGGDLILTAGTGNQVLIPALRSADAMVVNTDINTGTPPTTEAVTGYYRINDLAHDDALSEFGFKGSNEIQFLNLMEGGAMSMRGTDVGGSEQVIFSGDPDGAAGMRFAGAEKVATLTGGIDVTGDITVSGDVDGIDIATDVAANTAKISYVIPLTTTAALIDEANAINTDASKIQGFAVYNTTSNSPVWAAGPGDNDVWNDGTGTLAHTPAP